jgi:phosphoglycolate phosphatase
MKFRAVIFDLDGTLLNTLADLAAAHNRALTELGLPCHPTDAYRQFIGNGARVCVERTLPHEYRTSDIIDAGLAIQQREYSRTWHEQTRPYEGIDELLDKLQLRGINLAVLSNKDHIFTQQCVTFFFPNIAFDRIQGFTGQVPHKPHPGGALMVADDLECIPREILFLGDSEVDIATARAADMYPVGALWGFRSEQELVMSGAADTVHHPSEVMRLFQ